MTERGEKRGAEGQRGETGPQNDSLSPLSFCPTHCHSERSEESSLPSLSFFTPPPVILSEAKNLFSRLRGMARKILRSEAPQNDREGGRSAPQNDSFPPLVILYPTPVILSAAKNLPSRPCHSLPHPLVILSEAKNLFSHPLSSCPTPVILSEAKNLFSCLKGMARKILRSEAPQNDREGGEKRPSE